MVSDKFVQAVVGEVRRRLRYAGPEPLRFGVEREKQIINPADPGTMSGSLELVERMSMLPGWTPKLEHGHLVSVIDPTRKVEVMTDAGRSQTELVYGVYRDLRVFDAFSREIMGTVIREAKAIDHVMLGVGRHPVCAGSHRDWVHEKPRYGVVRDSLSERADETVSTACNQVTIDARSEQHLMGMLNIGVAFGGPFAAIFANSSVCNARRLDEMASRMFTWNRISPAPERIGIPMGRFTSLEDYFKRILRIPYMLHVFANLTAEKFGQSVEDAVKCYAEGLIHILQVHIACIWNDARFRMNPVGNGDELQACVEFRVPCAGVDEDADIADTAFHVGLAEMAVELDEKIVQRHDWDVWRQARESGAKYAFGGRLGGRSIKGICHQLLAFAKAGLVRRGLGELELLEPIERRFRTWTSPAQELLEIFGAGGPEGVQRIIDARAFERKPVQLSLASA